MSVVKAQAEQERAAEREHSSGFQRKIFAPFEERPVPLPPDERATRRAQWEAALNRRLLAFLLKKVGGTRKRYQMLRMRFFLHLSRDTGMRRSLRNY